MNKIDVLLNGICQKHLEIEIIESSSTGVPRRKELSIDHLHAAMLAAFHGGVRHASAIKRNISAPLIADVDIDVSKFEHGTSRALTIRLNKSHQS